MWQTQGSSESGYLYASMLHRQGASMWHRQGAYWHGSMIPKTLCEITLLLLCGQPTSLYTDCASSHWSSQLHLPTTVWQLTPKTGWEKYGSQKHPILILHSWFKASQYLGNPLIQPKQCDIDTVQFLNQNAWTANHTPVSYTHLTLPTNIAV